MSLRCPQCNRWAFLASRRNQVIDHQIQLWKPRDFLCTGCGTRLRHHKYRKWVMPVLAVVLLVVIGALKPLLDHFGLPRNPVLLVLGFTFFASAYVAEWVMGYARA